MPTIAPTPGLPILASSASSSRLAQSPVTSALLAAPSASPEEQEKAEEEKDVKPCVAFADFVGPQLDRCVRECCATRPSQPKYQDAEEDDDEKEKPSTNPDIFFTPSTLFRTHSSFVSSSASACRARYGCNMVHNYLSSRRAAVECSRRHKRKDGGGCRARINADWVEEEGGWMVDFGTTRWGHNHPPLEREQEVEYEGVVDDEKEEDEEEDPLDEKEEMEKLENFLRLQGANDDEDDDDIWWAATTSSLAMHRLVAKRETLFEQQRQQSRPILQARSAALLLTHLSSPSLSPTSTLYTPSSLRLTLLRYLHFTHLLSVPAFPISNAMIALFLFSRCAKAGRRVAAGMLAALQGCQAVILDLWEGGESEGGEEQGALRREAKTALEEFVRERPAEEERAATMSEPEVQATAEEVDDDKVELVVKLDKGKGREVVNMDVDAVPAAPPPLPATSPPRKRRLSSTGFAHKDDDDQADEPASKRPRSNEPGSTAGSPLPLLLPTQLPTPTPSPSSPPARTSAHSDPVLVHRSTSSPPDAAIASLPLLFQLPTPASSTTTAALFSSSPSLPDSRRTKPSRLPVRRLPPFALPSAKPTPLAAFLSSLLPDTPLHDVQALASLLAGAGCSTGDDLFLLAQLEESTLSLFFTELEKEGSAAVKTGCGALRERLVEKLW